MTETEELIIQGAALRDFFFASGARGLRAAFAAISEAGVVQETENGDATDWTEVEYGFNRLFVGPMAPQAPPYSSIYLDPEPVLMGASTAEARGVLHGLGLASPYGSALPEDHVSLEIDAMLHILAAGPGEPEVARLGTALLEHMGTWFPSFTLRARQAGPEHPVLARVLDELDYWLAAVQAAWPQPHNHLTRNKEVRP